MKMMISIVSAFSQIFWNVDIALFDDFEQD